MVCSYAVALIFCKCLLYFLTGFDRYLLFTCFTCSTTLQPSLTFVCLCSGGFTECLKLTAMGIWQLRLSMRSGVQEKVILSRLFFLYTGMYQAVFLLLVLAINNFYSIYFVLLGTFTHSILHTFFPLQNFPLWSSSSC